MKIEEHADFMAIVSEATGRELSNDTIIGMWFAALEKYTFEDCLTALQEVLAESSRFLTQADVATRVKSIRAARIQAAGTPPSPPDYRADEDWEEYQKVYMRWLAVWQENVANGLSPDEAQRIAHQEVNRPLALEATIPYRHALEMKGSGTP